MEMSRGLLIATLDARLVCTRVWKKHTLNRKNFERESEGRGEKLGAKRQDGMKSTTQKDAFVCVERNRNRFGNLLPSHSFLQID